VLDVTRLLFIDGIQLIGLPAPPVAPHRRLFALSTLQVSRFNVSTKCSRQLSMPHRHLFRGRSVSALLPGLSPYALTGRCKATV